jgi:hypothetical protein
MKLGTRIRRVRRVDAERYRVAVEYTDGFTGTVYLGAVFEHAAKKPLVAEILRGGLFGRCFVESGALAWPNGYELCPDAIRARIIEQRRDRAA